MSNMGITGDLSGNVVYENGGSTKFTCLLILKRYKKIKNQHYKLYQLKRNMSFFYDADHKIEQNSDEISMNNRSRNIYL